MKTNYYGLFALFLVLGTSKELSAGYGDTLGAGYPAWRERSIIVLTNACRLGPVAYRDKYVGSYSILLPANYPATWPLYWNYDLNRSSRYHAVDMANNCGMQHNSCNGDSFSVRLRSFYSGGGWIGENIAAGSTEPVAALRQWIMDGSTPAADKSAYDGHRKNIMSTNFREMGAGYAYGPQQYNNFWVQDFGGGRSTFTNKIIAGSHLFIGTVNTTFMVNYYDSLNQQPTKSVVVVDNLEHALTLDCGTSAKGSYIATLPKASVCREYFFSFTGGGGTVYRYPENGYLVTAGEGSCLKEYAPPHSAILHGIAPDKILSDAVVASVEIINLSGCRILYARGRQLLENSKLPAGIYYRVDRGSTGAVVSRSLFTAAGKMHP